MVCPKPLAGTPAKQHFYPIYKNKITSVAKSREQTKTTSLTSLSHLVNEVDWGWAFGATEVVFVRKMR